MGDRLGEIGKNTQEILASGLHRTAISMETMIESDVRVEKMELELSNKWSLNGTLKEGSSFIMLKTELIGKVSGINYFIISEGDVKTLCAKCISDEVAAGESEDSKYMMIEFLKELENVIAAATISEIADRFQMHLFGDVPKIQAMEAVKVAEVIAKETSRLKPEMSVTCQLDIPNMNISPSFIWFFNGAFYKQLENILNEQVLEKDLTPVPQ